MTSSTFALLMDDAIETPTEEALNRVREALGDESEPELVRLAAILLDPTPLRLDGLDARLLRDVLAEGIADGRWGEEDTPFVDWLARDRELAEAVAAIRRADVDALADRAAGTRVDVNLARRFLYCALPLPVFRRLADRLDARDSIVEGAILAALRAEPHLEENAGVEEIEGVPLELTHLRLAMSLGPFLLRAGLRQAAASFDIKLREGDRIVAHRDDLDADSDCWQLSGEAPLAVVVGPFRKVVGRRVTLTFGASARAQAEGTIDSRGVLLLRPLPLLAELGGLLGRPVDLRELAAGGMVFSLNLE